VKIRLNIFTHDTYYLVTWIITFSLFSDNLPLDRTHPTSGANVFKIARSSYAYD